MLYEEHRKFQLDLSNYKLQIIDLESQLVAEKESKAVLERNYQRSLQDLQHYKIKNVVEKPIYDLNESDNMDVDFESVFSKNEDLIKENFQLVENINIIEKNLNELTRKCEDLEMELSDTNSRNADLSAFNDELKLFIEQKKCELTAVNTLKLRLEELEGATKMDNITPFISLNINKIKDLELKCFNLEKDNEKFKVNHANLMLLSEENASLTNENERLQQMISEFRNANLNKAYEPNFESNTDASLERHSRHIERENEILKCQQAQLKEQNTELHSKIVSLEGDVKSVKQGSINYQVLLHDKEQRIIVQTNEIRCLRQDCLSFKLMLETFTNQINLDSDTSVLLSRLGQLFDSIDNHQSELDQQIIVLDNLVQLIGVHTEKLECLNTTDLCTKNNDTDIDRQMVLELRREVERLNEELESQRTQLQDMTQRCQNYLTNESRISLRLDESDDHMSEMGFSDSGVQHTNTKERNSNIFKKLSGVMLESVKQILGYSLELGPNGHVTCRNCLSDDDTAVLEFKITMPSGGNEQQRPPQPCVVLIDNAYTREVMSKLIDHRNSYPALLAHITLDLLEKTENSMT